MGVPTVIIQGGIKVEAQLITIANRLNRTDSITGLDVWYKFQLKNIQYSKERVTTVNGTQVSMSESFNILLPFTGKYIPYLRWKDLSNKDDYYTLSQGDYIFLTEITEDIQPNTIMQIKNKYRGYVCEVRSIIEVPERNGVTIQLKVSGV